MKQPLHLRPQKGIVLVVALIMLAVIAMTSTAAMRLALSSDMIAANLRSNNLSEQAAEAALRWCESELINLRVGAARVLDDVPAGEEKPWQNLANWTGNNVINVPAAVLTGLNNQPTPYTVMPQCLIQRQELSLTGMSDNERSKMKDVFRAYLVTVRAFSPGFIRAAGQSAGGEVWMQSLLYLPWNQD